MLVVGSMKQKSRTSEQTLSNFVQFLASHWISDNHIQKQGIPVVKKNVYSPMSMYTLMPNSTPSISASSLHIPQVQTARPFICRTRSCVPEPYESSYTCILYCISKSPPHVLPSTYLRKFRRRQCSMGRESICSSRTTGLTWLATGCGFAEVEYVPGSIVGHASCFPLGTSADSTGHGYRG